MLKIRPKIKQEEERSLASNLALRIHRGDLGYSQEVVANNVKQDLMTDLKDDVDQRTKDILRTFQDPESRPVTKDVTLSAAQESWREKGERPHPKFMLQPVAAAIEIFGLHNVGSKILGYKPGQEQYEWNTASAFVCSLGLIPKEEGIPLATTGQIDKALQQLYQLNKKFGREVIDAAMLDAVEASNEYVVDREATEELRNNVSRDGKAT